MEPAHDEHGPVSVVFGSPSPLVGEILRSLAERGRRAVAIEELPLEASTRVPRTADADASRAVEASFTDACGDRSVDLVVLAHAPAGATRHQPLLAMDDHDWDLGCESIVRQTLLVLQAVKRRMTSGGSVVMVLPTISLAGAAGFAAWSAAAEAQRVMAKVAARRWGPDGIRVNVVSVPPSELSGDPGHAVATDRTKADPALAEETSAPAATADLVCMLATTDARSLTGSTLVADGGSLMVP